MLQQILPERAYLATWYQDLRTGINTRRVYWDDGRVEAFDGENWRAVCHLTDEQVDYARKAIAQCGLLSLQNLEARPGIFDTALMVYAWRIGGATGSFANHLYPAVLPEETENLEHTLYDMEAQASGPV